MFLSLSLFFFCYLRSPFSISCNASLVEVYPFSLLLSRKLLISPSIFNESLAGWSTLGCRPLLFITCNISYHSLLTYSVSVEKPAASLIKSPLYIPVSPFLPLDSLFIFNIQNFNYDVSWGRPIWVPCDWDPLCFMYLCTFFSSN